MQDKDTTTSTFDQLFEQVFNEKFRHQIQQMEVDKYAKKFHTPHLIELVAHAQLEQQRGLRDISNSLNDDNINQAIGLNSISASQISRKLREVPSEILELLFRDITSHVSKEIGIDTVNQQLGRLHLIDSTTISLCLSRYPWASYRKTKGGVKLHLRLRFFELNDGHQVHPTALHGTIWDVDSPDMVMMDRFDIAKQVWVHILRPIAFAEVRAGVNHPYSHFPHISLNAFAVDLVIYAIHVIYVF